MVEVTAVVGELPAAIVEVTVVTTLG
jgi:hypothetical protein